MKMKQLLRYTSSLLRTVLLIGAFLIANTNAMAQTEAQLAAMPDAFETVGPATIIGNTQSWYYIQFYNGSDRSYLSDQGENKNVRSKDYLPFAKNLQWQLESTGAANQFYLKSRSGHYVYLEGSNYKCSSSNKTALTFTLRTNSGSGGGYDISPVGDNDNAMGRQGSSGVAPVWTDITSVNHNNHRVLYTRLRIVKLKEENVAHIIYWQEPIYKDGNIVDRNTNTRGGWEGFTKHHYLTYSGTDDSQSNISSRASVLWYYDAWALRTAAAYHLDGLWQLEEAENDGEFYIKKYNSSDYLNSQEDNNGLSVLGTKSLEYGKYLLESPNANRYTRIQNVKTYEMVPLSAAQFYNWNSWLAGSASTSNADVEFHIGDGWSFSSGSLVAGVGTVYYTTYADLTGCTKIVFEGTSGLELRVLLNRLEVGNGGGDNNGGAIIDRRCTIGSNGKAEVDLSDLSYVHLNAIKVNSGSGSVSSVKLVKPKSETASLADYQFYNWNGVDATATHSSETPATGICYYVNNNRYATQVIAGLEDASVHYSTYTDLTGCSKIIFEGDPGLQPRILLNRPEGEGNGGTAIERIATIGSNGKAEVDLSDLPYVHLNAIKLANDSPSGTITSITLLKPSNERNSLTCSGTDGAVVRLKSGNPDDYWYAGFLPVEVPASRKDDFYQVILGLNPVTKNQIELTGGNMNVSNVNATNGHIYGATFTPTAAYQNAFKYTDFNTRSYKTIVIKFGSAVPAGWVLHTYGGQWDGNESLAGKTEYTITLTPGTNIDDFTIYNTDANASPITISEIYFTPDFPLEMINHDGYASGYSEESGARQLWQLEQVNDYSWFRVKDLETEKYLKGFGQMTTNPDEAERKNIQGYLNDFYIRWFYVNPVAKEIPINKYVTHKRSYLKNIAAQYTSLDLSKQGLATGEDSDWWNLDLDMPEATRVNHLKGGTQKVNHFEITHYVKRGETLKVEFPTVLNNNNDHRYFQRWYNYDEDDTAMDLNNLKAHLGLDTPENKEVQYFLYNNGIVTGVKLNWEDYDDGGFNRYALRNFNFTNSDGKAFTVAADVSRYSDIGYDTNGDLIEPSLTMRYIFYMKDAKTMATNLTACTYGSSKWLESKEFHFPFREIHYENQKEAGYRGEFIGLRHVFSDYWVFDGIGTGDDNLISAVNDNNSGKIKVEIYDPNEVGIRLGGYNKNISLTGTEEGNDADYEGFYFYDKIAGKTSYGDSRFIVFRYPANHKIDEDKTGLPVYIRVYFDNNGTKYQLAQFTVIFDPNTETLPWTSVNGSGHVKDSPRDPNQLRDKAGVPIAKITFDYPEKSHYLYPDNGSTIHNQGEHTASQNAGIDKSSPVPLTFDKTNYAFDGDDCNWGSYAMVTSKSTVFGKYQKASPANASGTGYGVNSDPGLQSAFLYIDASEQPGDICSAPFRGNFCAGSKLMFSGWISGSNVAGGSDNRCPGGVTLTVKGLNTSGVTETIYRFCPGQCYELDDGEVNGVSFGVDEVDRNKYNVVWQQFYFEFNVSTVYTQHWIEVNNNCVSSNGGDFMLDDIEVFAMVPEVEPEMNTPLCVSVDETTGDVVTEMRLLKLTVDYDDLRATAGVNMSVPETDENKPHLGFVFLEKETFLSELKSNLGLDVSLTQLAKDIEEGLYNYVDENYSNFAGYKSAFDAALLGRKEIWKSDDPNANTGAAVMYFKWSRNFKSMESYSFFKAVSKVDAVFTYEDSETDKRFLIMNGNFPVLPWKTDTEYYIVPENNMINNFSEVYDVFNICSKCSKASVFKIEPPYTVLSMESSNSQQELEVCEGKIPTLLTDLKGYDINGNLVPMHDLNFDWWMGDATTTPVTLATLENYHAQSKNIGGTTIKLDKALSTLRIYYPEVTSLDGIMGHLAVNPNPELTLEMVNYLKELVDAGQLVLHQKSISVPALKASDNDPYFYLVACPIHDGYYDKALNPKNNEYVTYFCDEPQGLRMKVGERAPTLKTGFVPNENGYPSYAYPTNSDPVLSIRLAKAAQFETVKHGTVNDDPAEDYCSQASTEKHFLWLPIRNAEVQSSGSNVVERAADHNIYLASTNDPTWDKEIYNAMNQYDTQGNLVGSLPIIGKIVKLYAIDTGKASGTEVDNNRLCIYFTSNFEVREGYNYTLSLPFKENGANTCDGTILINMKIVPDYEVWTGAAGNTDWNNDENWRRADGNTTNSSGLNGDELYRASGALTNANSPLHEYMTNYDNYRTAKDRVFRKGFAPLYCTHVLIKSDEWGNAPVLYDALDGKNSLTASPFPNLRDEDNWNGQGAEASATPILRYDMQARLYDIWSETYGSAPASNKGRSGDLLAEMYQVNSCDEIVFQPGTELMNAHLLNYNSAWVEYKLDNKRWYLLGSPLQGTISGEWYAPKSTAQQKTTYYDPVSFGTGYDRYNPAIYQRSWDKAKAVLYEIGSSYATTDDSQTGNLGTGNEGKWSNNTSTAEWQVEGGGTADEYLDRLGYKPMGGNKANVAIQGIWSNTYNDATVDYANGGFSVMVMNHLKGTANDQSNDVTIVRLPKEDTMYDYYQFSQTGANDGGTDTELSVVRDAKNRAKNRGRLKTDLLLPTSTNKTEKADSRYGDKRTYTRIPIKEGDLNTMLTSIGNHQETVSAGVSNLGYYLVENPFPCGLNMDKFFAGNKKLLPKYWILTATGKQHLVQKVDDEWISSTSDGFATADGVAVPGQGFFVEADPSFTDPDMAYTDGVGQTTTITFTKDMQAQSRYGVQSGTGKTYKIVVGTKQKMKTVTETITMDDGTTQTATVEVPVTDASGNYVLEDLTEDVVVYNYDQTTETDKQYKLKTRGETAEALLPGLVITAERGDFESSALVMQRGTASNDFLPEEDTETFITSDLQHVPTVYTLCGRLATTINSIHDFRSLSLGVESNSDAPCTLTFKGVEMLGDSIAFYDAVEKTLTPLESGMQVSVSGQTQNRYYLVRGLNLKEAAEETHLQIFTEGLTAKVIASTAEPILVVRCFDTSGRLLYTANPDSAEYSFTLPGKGIYIIEAQTENDRKTIKVMTK